MCVANHTTHLFYYPSRTTTHYHIFSNACLLTRRLTTQRRNAKFANCQTHKWRTTQAEGAAQHLQLCTSTTPAFILITSLHTTCAHPHFFQRFVACSSPASLAIALPQRRQRQCGHPGRHPCDPCLAARCSWADARKRAQFQRWGLRWHTM